MTAQSAAEACATHRLILFRFRSGRQALPTSNASVVSPKFLLRLASFRCVHRKADEGGIPGRMLTEENAARCVQGRLEP